MSGETISGSASGLIAEPESLPSFTAVRGYENVLAHHEQLAALAERCEQRGVMDDLPFYLSASRLWGRVPHLLLLPRSGGQLQAAVLLYEYGVGPLSSGVFVPADLFGERSVLAPEPIRSIVAFQAAEFLLDRGAHLVYFSLRNGDFSSFQPRRAVTCATRHHVAHRTLPIAATFDATVAGMGADTRRSLRRYPRLVESKLGSIFVPEADLSELEFLALSQNSVHPAYPWIAKARFRKARGLKDGLLAGLKAADGSWLSLIGGRRRNEITYLDWQVNIKAHPALSIGTAMRAYLIEHEIVRGTLQLTFEEGTTHTMNRAFTPENVCDLLLARLSLSPRILRQLAARLPLKNNMLADNLLNPNLVWHGSHPTPHPRQPK